MDKFQSAVGIVDNPAQASGSPQYHSRDGDYLRFNFQIDASGFPFFAGFHNNGSDEPQTSGFVGENTRHSGAPPNLFVQPFDAVGGA